MVDKDMEQRVRDAINHTVPDVLDNILSSCDSQKGNVIKMNNSKKNNWYKPLVAAAAFVVIVGIGGVGYNQWQNQNTVRSIVTLDVNPSIEINVNKNERVLSVIPQNEDGKTIVGDMDFKNTDLDVVVNALVGSMLQHGYLSEIQNAILVSVENDDVNKSIELEEKISNIIDSMLKNNQFESAVFSQSVSADDEIKQLATTYGISEGKAALINAVIAQDNTLTFEALAPMSVHEIALIMDSKQIDANNISKTGQASEKGYLSKDKLKDIVFAHAKVSEANVKNLEIEYDVEDGIMVYELEFNVGNTEYEYDVHAVTGEIIKFTKKADSTNTNQSTQNSTNSNLIGENKAKEVALSHAKVSEKQLSKFEIELDKENNQYVYEIDFVANNIEYEYVINAMDGSVIKNEKESKSTTGNNSNQSNSTTNNQTSNNQTYIGEEKAKKIAFEHGKVNEKQAKKLEVKFDIEDNIAVYEIEFETSDKDYDYVINAINGKVIDYDIEANNNISNGITSKPSNSDDDDRYDDDRYDDDRYDDDDDDDDRDDD